MVNTSRLDGPLYDITCINRRSELEWGVIQRMETSILLHKVLKQQHALLSAYVQKLLFKNNSIN
jgi:hypothetical protein